MNWKHQSLHKLCLQRLCKAVDSEYVCTDGCGWTFILSTWSWGQYHRCIEQKATTLLSSRQVFNGITEPAPAVFQSFEMYTFYRRETGELAECWKLCFHVLSLFMRVQPQAMTTWQISFRVLNPEQGMHNFSAIVGTSGLDAIFVGEALLYDDSFSSSYKLR